MRHRRLTAATLTAVSGLAVAGLLAGPANASTDTPSTTAPAATPAPTTSKSTSPLVSAKISGIDLKAGKITVSVTLDGTKVLVDGVQTALSDLPLGANLHLGGTGTNLSLSADSSKLVEGTLTKVVNSTDPTVNVKLAGGATQTLPVSANANVSLDGVKSTLAKLAGLTSGNTTVSVNGLTGMNGSVGTTITARTVKPTASPTASPTATTSPTTSPAASPTASRNAK
jgi:hypothetical protein